MTIRKRTLIATVLVVSMCSLMTFACGQKRHGDEEPVASPEFANIPAIAGPGRAEAIDLAQPVLRTLVITVPDGDAQAVFGKEFEIAGFDQGGQLILPSVQVVGGTCGDISPEHGVISEVKLLRWDQEGRVQELRQISTMVAYFLESNQRFGIQISNKFLVPCAGVRIEVGIIGMATRQIGEVHPPDSTPTAPSPDQPDLSVTPVPGPQPTPIASPIVCPEHPSLKTELVMHGKLSSQEGCQEVWRRSMKEIMFEDHDLCAKRVQFSYESDKQLLKFIQNRDATQYNLLWIHGLNNDAQTSWARRLGVGEAIQIAGAGSNCGTNSGGSADSVVQLQSADSLMFFNNNPINQCLVAGGARGTAALMPRGPWVANGEKAFHVRYQLAGRDPYIEFEFAIENQELDRRFAAYVASGRSTSPLPLDQPIFRVFANDLHVFLDAGTQKISPQRSVEGSWTVRLADRVLLRRMLAHWRDLEFVLEVPKVEGDRLVGGCIDAVRMAFGELVRDPRYRRHFDDLARPGRNPALLGEGDLTDLQE